MRFFILVVVCAFSVSSFADWEVGNLSPVPPHISSQDASSVLSTYWSNEPGTLRTKCENYYYVNNFGTIFAGYNFAVYSNRVCDPVCLQSSYTKLISRSRHWTGGDPIPYLNLSTSVSGGTGARGYSRLSYDWDIYDWKDGYANAVTKGGVGTKIVGSRSGGVNSESFQSSESFAGVQTTKQVLGGGLVLTGYNTTFTVAFPPSASITAQFSPLPDPIWEKELYTLFLPCVALLPGYFDSWTEYWYLGVACENVEAEGSEWMPPGIFYFATAHSGAQIQFVP